MHERRSFSWSCHGFSLVLLDLRQPDLIVASALLVNSSQGVLERLDSVVFFKGLGVVGRQDVKKQRQEIRVRHHWCDFLFQ